MITMELHAICCVVLHGRRDRAPPHGVNLMNHVVKRKASAAIEATGPHDEEEREVVAGPALNENIQEQIGAKLKALFDESVNQAVPDRFVELLQALAEKEEDGAGSNGSELS